MWFPEVAEVFEQCRIAMETGIMPDEGGFMEQSALFVEAFPSFVERWKTRRYYAIWSDINDYVPKVLEAIGKMFGGKK